MGSYADSNLALLDMGLPQPFVDKLATVLALFRVHCVGVCVDDGGCDSGGGCVLRVAVLVALGVVGVVVALVLYLSRLVSQRIAPLYNTLFLTTSLVSSRQLSSADKRHCPP